MIYIDRLSLKSCLQANRLILANNLSGGGACIQVLDPIKKNFKSWLLLKGMQLLGIDVQEAVFFSGHLRTRDGENIYTATSKALNQIAYNVAESTISESKVFSALNHEWGKNTIFLCLAKHFYRIAEYVGHCTVHKIMIADALSRDITDEIHYLVLGLPAGFTSESFGQIREQLDLHTYSLREWSLKNNRISVLLLMAYVAFNRLLKHSASIFHTQPKFGDVTTPALLLLQEDDLSMDRSYRGQPHWLFKGDPPPAFRTLVLETNRKLYNEPDRDELERFGVYSVPKGFIYHYSKKHAVQKKIDSAIHNLLYQSVFGPRSSVDIVFQLVLYFMKASLLADFCSGQNIKAFMTSENYHSEAVAMNLIGPQMGIHTISYQYANRSECHIPMMITADTMFSFSPLFHERWKRGKITSREYVDIGYIFDSSFNKLDARVSRLKKKLNKNGAEFIIVYLDESVQRKDDKYGLVHEEDHYNEILPLVKEIIDEKDIAVITKPQFQKNALTAMFSNDQYLKQAIQTGRFLELHHGKHRNNILPAEAAMASDMVVGHAVGGTAGLEAALIGKRCILLNHYEMKGANIDIFKCADILYRDIDSALKAIAAYRNGDEKYKNLGNWSTIIEQFDPFCDGKSSTRLRNFIESKILA